MVVETGIQRVALRWPHQKIREGVGGAEASLVQRQPLVAEEGEPDGADCTEELLGYVCIERLCASRGGGTYLIVQRNCVD